MGITRDMDVADNHLGGCGWEKKAYFLGTHYFNHICINNNYLTFALIPVEIHMILQHEK